MAHQSATLSELEARKLAQKVADDLEAELRRTPLPEGRLIGTVSALADRFGVGNNSMRQALRMLEQQGMLETRPGVGGGVLVGASGDKAASFSLATYLEFFNIASAELLAARALIDGLAAKLAAERAPLQDAMTLRNLIVRFDLDGFRSMADYGASMEQTSRVAQLSGNPLLRVFSDVLRHAALEGLTGSPAKRDEIQRGIRIYTTNIAEAIISGDGNQANVIAHNWYVRELPDMMIDLSLSDGATGQDKIGREGLEFETQVRWVLFGRRAKTAEVLARLLLRETRLRQLGMGDRLGSESELLDRYGVARSVLREAVRMLERHGILNFKPGRGGGLFVGSADSRTAISSFVNHMRRVPMSPEQLLEVRICLEPELARQSARRPDATGAMQIPPASPVLSLFVAAVRAMDPHSPISAAEPRLPDDPSLAYRSVLEALGRLR